MTARELTIACFAANHKHPDDQPGLELMLAKWLGIRRPVVTIRGEEFAIRCANALDAKMVTLNFGGIVDDGFVIRGEMKDLDEDAVQPRENNGRFIKREMAR